MKAKEADDLGCKIAALVHQGQPAKAHALLAPILAKRTPFRLLGRIGRPTGAAPLTETNAFLDEVAAGRSEGGWVVIGSALGEQLERDMADALARCRGYIVAADVWYAADILGERVPGPALVARFGAALDLLAPWREDADRWVRRTVGVAVHYWAKSARGAAERQAQAEGLLAFLEPMFGEWDMNALKGVGWGLKTLGKYYPHRVADWLVEQVVQRRRRHRALMLRKALTHLPAEQRARVTGGEA